ncbi:MAG TPA: class A beta-lactamase [Longimicrobium sp.]|nr:class A beta-lactamase [Longimicrobium sp.]
MRRILLAVPLLVICPSVISSHARLRSADAHPAAAARGTWTADTAMRDTAALMAAIRAAAAETGGVVGVHVRHLENGWELGMNAGEPFFMSSVTKLPISVRILRQVRRGRIRLADDVRITREQMAPGRSAIRDANPAGVTLPVEQLLRAAITQSDNTASDALLRLAGGPDSVNAELARAGIHGIRVSRPYQRLDEEVGGRISAGDTRDTSTPRVMTALLAALHAGRLLGPAETRLLLGWMTDSENPRTRIIAGLPAGTAVAHKTGTWGQSDAPGAAAMNDVGIITLPGARGHLALAVFVRNATAADSVAEAAIASITRAVWEHAAGGAASPPRITASNSRPTDRSVVPRERTSGDPMP